MPRKIEGKTERQFGVHLKVAWNIFVQQKRVNYRIFLIRIVTQSKQSLNSKHICQMDCLKELRGYSQGAKYEIKTKLEMKKWEKKAVGNCKMLKKKKKKNNNQKTDPTWCLVRYEGMAEECSKMTCLSQREQVYPPQTRKSAETACWGSLILEI